MMRTRMMRVAGVLLLARAAWAAEGRRVFVLEKREDKLLCAYTSEREWREASVATDKPQYVAVVARRGRRVVTVWVERYSEDSQTFDEYAIEGGRQVRELRRSIAHVTNRVRREQVWRIAEGRARLVRETWRDWRADREAPVDESLADFVGARVVPRTGEFPFWALASGRARCVAGTMAGLEVPVVEPRDR